MPYPMHAEEPDESYTIEDANRVISKACEIYKTGESIPPETKATATFCSKSPSVITMARKVS